VSIWVDYGFRSRGEPIVAAASLVLFGDADNRTQLRRAHLIGHKDLNTILAALTNSVAPVSNACLILLVISCVYAILGTQIFGQDHPELFGRFQVFYLPRH